MDEERKEQRLDFETLLRENRDYQSACDKKVSQALSTARANWERERQAEGERLRGELDAELNRRLQEERSALEVQRRDFESRMRQVAVAERLQQRGLDAAFAPWLTGESEESSMERVEQFTALFQSALSQAVAGRMRGGRPPKSPKAPEGLTRESLRGMSLREINGHWAEVSEALKG